MGASSTQRELQHYSNISAELNGLRCQRPQLSGKSWPDLFYMWLVVLPIVEVNPSTQIHSAGETTTVNCQATGRPQPHISWQLNEQALHSSDSHYLLTGKCPPVLSLLFPRWTSNIECVCLSVCVETAHTTHWGISRRHSGLGSTLLPSMWQL